MTLASSDPDDLHILEEARRQVQRQLEGIDRQIKRRMAALIPSLLPKRSRHARNALANPEDFLARYRMNLAALTAERQPEIDALSATLALQDRAIAQFRQRCDAFATTYSGDVPTTPVSISKQREAHVC
jgi:hypothetical protein